MSRCINVLACMHSNDEITQQSLVFDNLQDSNSITVKGSGYSIGCMHLKLKQTLQLCCSMLIQI